MNDGRRLIVTPPFFVGFSPQETCSIDRRIIIIEALVVFMHILINVGINKSDESKVIQNPKIFYLMALERWKQFDNDRVVGGPSYPRGAAIQALSKGFLIASVNSVVIGMSSNFGAGIHCYSFLYLQLLFSKKGKIDTFLAILKILGFKANQEGDPYPSFPEWKCGGTPKTQTFEAASCKFAR